MAKTQSLQSDDLKVSPPRSRSATRQRGITPSAALVPLQFKMPAEFVHDFKQEALNRDAKLNEFLKTCFDAFKNSKKSKA
jgi:hypothetical protein